MSLIQFSKKLIHIVEYYRYANVASLCMHTRSREIKNGMYLGVAWTRKILCPVYQSTNIVQVEGPLYYLSLANVIYIWQIYNTTDIKSGCVMHDLEGGKAAERTGLRWNWLWRETMNLLYMALLPDFIKGVLLRWHIVATVTMPPSW